MGRLGPDDRAGFRMVEVIEGYDRWADTYDREPNPLIALEQEVTLELAGDVSGRQVLDLGCGTGRYCVLLAERGARVVGVDPSPGMLEHARSKTCSSHQIELRHGTVESAALPAEHFDLAVAALTLGHLPKIEPVLREVARVLKRGGRLVVSDIHPYWPVSGHDYTEFFDRARQEYRIPQYPHLVAEYWRLLGCLGMIVEEIREPLIDSRLVESFPSLEGYLGIPLALILAACKWAPGGV